MILTNVICSIAITLSTNVVETDNGVKGCLCPPGSILLYVHECKQSVPATEKTVTTTVVERIEFVAANHSLFGSQLCTNGIVSVPHLYNPIQAANERELSRTVKHYRRSSEWVEFNPVVSPAFNTNQFIQWGGNTLTITNLTPYTWTNVIGTSIDLTNTLERFKQELLDAMRLPKGGDVK